MATIARQLRNFCTTSRRLGQIFTIQNMKDFEEKVLNSKDKVVVDFYADWCSPCRLLAPKLETRIGMEKDVHLAKVNVDNLDELAARHQVTTIPHVVGFNKGKEVNQFIGNKDPDIIHEFIKKLNDSSVDNKMTIDFYYMPESPPCRAVEMVAKMIGVEFNKRYVNLATKEQLKDDYVKLNPLHKVPFIVDGDLKINESCAIMAYLINKYKPDDEFLYPKDPVERARVDELLFYAVGTMSPAASRLLSPYIFGPVKKLNSDYEAAYNEVLGYLNKRLGDNSSEGFIIGDHLTIADVYISASFTYVEACGYDLQKYSHLVSYLERMKAAIPNYSEINDKPTEHVKMVIKLRQEGK